MHHKLISLAVSIAAALGIMAVALPGLAAATASRTYGCGSAPSSDTSFARRNIRTFGNPWDVFYNPTRDGRVYMFTGPNNGCPHAFDAHDIYGNDYGHVDGDRVIVWCGYNNTSAGRDDLGYWDYLYNIDEDKFGWVQDKYVTWTGHGTTCR